MIKETVIRCKSGLSKGRNKYYWNNRLWEKTIWYQAVPGQINCWPKTGAFSTWNLAWHKLSSTAV